MIHLSIENGLQIEQSLMGCIFLFDKLSWQFQFFGP